MSTKELLSGLAKRYLSESNLEALRRRCLQLNGATAPLLRLVHGTFDTAALARHLEQRIGHEFEILFVHSSINGLQPTFSGQPLDLVKMLIAYVGPQRTLALPAFYFGDPAIGGAGETFAQRPIFDLRRTPSQMGLVSELFRRTRGVVQSRNPVYRVAALGPLADELIAGHEQADTLCGRGTPFEVMARHDTLILGIGKPFEVLTQVHHAEHVLGDAFPVPHQVNSPLAMTIVDGKEEIAYRLPRTGLAWRRDMWRLRQIMTPETLREWSFHGAPMFATRAADVTAAITAAAARGETIYVRP